MGGAGPAPPRRRPETSGEAGGGDESLVLDRDRNDPHGGGGRPALEAERPLDGHHQLVVERVAGVACDDVAVDRATEEREVADEVEDLVADELVAIAESVERPALADDEASMPSDGALV